MAVPFAVSEVSTVTATIAGPDGATVRRLSTTATAAGGVSWDGRAATGKPVPDGRYTVTLRARDTAGNVGDPVAVDVDVYAALASVTRSPAQLYPQDGDALARSSTVSFRLLSRASSPSRSSMRAARWSGRRYADRSLGAGAHVSGRGTARSPAGRTRSPGPIASSSRRRTASSGPLSRPRVLADAFRLGVGRRRDARTSRSTVTAVSRSRSRRPRSSWSASRACRHGRSR